MFTTKILTFTVLFYRDSKIGNKLNTLSDFCVKLCVIHIYLFVMMSHINYSILP